MKKLDIFINFIIFIKICFILFAITHGYLKRTGRLNSELDIKVMYWKGKIEFVFIALISQYSSILADNTEIIPLLYVSKSCGNRFCCFEKNEIWSALLSLILRCDNLIGKPKAESKSPRIASLSYIMQLALSLVAIDCKFFLFVGVKMKDMSIHPRLVASI